MKETAPVLVFSGHEAGIVPWTLLGFILLSAGAHLFGFYLFQTVYPPAARVAPPPAQVSLLTPGTPEADTLLRWVNSEDPALIAQPRKADIPGLLDLPYLPSYSTVHARPSLAEPAESPLPFPSGAGGLDLVQLALPHPASAAPPPENAPTTLTFSGDLQGQSPDPAPALAPLRAAQPGELRPARFLLGVSARSRYVFLQDSSGDKALDAAAGRILEQVQFRHPSAALAWGFATFSWGASAYGRPSPSSAP